MNLASAPTFARASLLPLFAAFVLCAGRTAFAEAEADLLVSYDASHANAVGGQDNANVLAANAVAGCNLVHERSGTGARIRIVGYYQCAQANYQRTSKGGFVNWMASYDLRISDVVDVGNAKGADLVTFICVSTDDGAAAVAQQPGRYSAFDPGSFWAAVVAHELGGHNFGCDHRGGRATPGQKTVMMHNYCDGGGSTPPYFFSNPNIWLNGARLLGEGSCLGDAVNGGDNAYLVSTTCQGVADNYARDIAGPSLGSVIRRWKFNLPAGAAPAGTVIADEVAGAPATIRGTGATFTGDAVRLPGGTTGNTAANSIAAYIDLPNGVFSALTNMTIEVWANTRSAQNFERIIDIGRTIEAGDGLGAAGEYTGTPGSPAPGATSASDEIGISATVGTDINQQRFLGGLNGTVDFIDSGLPAMATVLHHYAISFTDTATGGTLKWYRDGQLITFIDVTWHLAQIEDVNNWLGRSLWSGDAMSHMYFHDVRIHNTAISDRRVLANFLLGPNYTAANATMNADDAVGASSFNSALHWSDGLAPSAGKSYETTSFRLRTPADGVSRSFAGASLKLSGGLFTWKGTGSSTITVNDFILAGGGCEVLNAGTGTFTLAGNLAVKSEEAVVRATNGPITISANLSGSAPLLFVNNTVTLSGTNSGYTGKITVGDGRFSSLRIDSEARLGPNPSAFTADQLTLNRGILYNTSNVTIDDPNRGIRIGASAALFNVTPGTTLTIAVPIAGTSSGDTLVTAPLFSNPVSGMLIKENSGTLVLTHPNNSHCGEIFISAGELRLDGAGRFNNGDTPMPVAIGNGTLNLNTTANQNFGGVISGPGNFLKNNTGTTTLFAANTFTGSVTVNGGTLFANASNAATDRNFSYVSSITVSNNGTLRSSANALFGWDGTQTKPITVNAGGTLTTNAAGDDVNVGTVTLNGGTLAGFASTAWGSWNFKRVSTGKLIATDNSTVSALNVGLGSSNSIDVAAGKTLTFSGTITDLTSEGVCSLVQSGGTGTLLLTNTNTYTGATAINAGTLKLTGSLAAGSAVTIASGATLSGTGTVNGSLTFSAGSTHAPGNAVGAQTVVGALGYANTTRVKWTLNSNSNATGAASRVTAGAVTVTAGAAIDLIFNASGSTTNFFDTFWTQPRSWVVVSSSGMTGTFTLGTVSNDAGGRSASTYGAFGLTQSASGVTLDWTPKPYTAWRGAKFGTNAGVAATSDFLSNPEGDGLVNAWEYFHDTNPTSPSTTPLQAEIVDGRATLTFPRNTLATDVLAKIQGADAVTGPWNDLATSTGGASFTAVAGVIIENGTGSTRTVTFTDLYLTTERPQRFFRLWIQSQ